MLPESLGGSETILVVDDESTMLRVAALTLEPRGYRVLTAASGQQAIDLLTARPDLEISLALIDIVMPVIDGIALADMLRKIRPETHVLLCSALADQKLLDMAISRGLQTLPKPFTANQLARTIRDILDRPPAAAAAAG